MNSKRIALVAHDHKKDDLLRWARHNRELLARHHLFSTGTTGKLINEQLRLPVTRMMSGPLGGDAQISALIAEGKIDILFFFWDPLESQPHDPDVKALLRIAVVWNIPVAMTPGSADYIITSPLIESDYEPQRPDYTSHTRRLDKLAQLMEEEESG